MRFSPVADGQPGDLVPFTLQTVVGVPFGDEVQLRCTQCAGDDLHVLQVGMQAVSLTPHPPAPRFWGTTHGDPSCMHDGSPPIFR